MRKILIALVCAVALALSIGGSASAMTTDASTHQTAVRTIVKPALQPFEEVGFVGHIVDSEQPDFCMTWQGGEHPHAGDAVYMSQCSTIIEEVWLCGQNVHTHVGFCSPFAASATRVAIGQQGRSSRVWLIDPDRSHNYVLTFLGRGDQGKQWVFQNDLYSKRWMGVQTGMRAGHNYNMYWVKHLRGADVNFSTPEFTPVN